MFNVIVTTTKSETTATKAYQNSTVKAKRQTE